MLPSIVQLSLRSIHGTKLLRAVNLRSVNNYKYSKWVSRRPVAVVNEHELFDTDDTTKAVEQRTRSKTHRKKSRASAEEEKTKDKKENEMEESGTAAEPRYVALNADDKLIR